MGQAVGPILRMSDDIDGIIQAARDDNPDKEIRVIDRHAYVRIECDPPMLLTRASIEKELGRDYPLRELEGLMSSFNGIIDSSNSDQLIWSRRTV
jgi:toluene monooxygenase system protein D